MLIIEITDHGVSSNLPISISCSLNTTTLHYFVTYAVGAAARFGPNLLFFFYDNICVHKHLFISLFDMLTEISLK